MSGRATHDIDSLLTEIVAEAWAAGLTAAVEDQGWRSAGSQGLPDRRTMTDLELARRRSRWLLEGSNFDDGNEFAIGAATNRMNYAVGEEGLKYEAVPVPGVPDGDPRLNEAQQFIDVFTELNDLPSMEREAVWRYDRDGEFFIRLFPGDGIPEGRFAEPERVIPPAMGTWPVGMACEWGLVHPKGDRGTILGAYMDTVNGLGFVDESEFIHVKGNTTSEYVRGWPTWEPVRRSLIRAEELLVAMTATGKARAKIALITEIPNWSAAQADRLKNRLTERHQEQPNGDLPRKETTEDLPYGSHLRVREGTKVNFPSSNLGAADMIEAIQANLRAAAQRTNMPEWMFSGMADQKYSNAFVVEAPSLREFRVLQKKVTTAFGEGRFGRRASLVWRAMRMAARAGVLNPAVLSAVRIKCTAPSLEVRDKSAEATTNVAYINAGVKPVALVQQELGIDPAEMAKLKEKFPEQQQQQPTPDELLAGVAGEHFGVGEDGQPWLSESAHQWVAEASKRKDGETWQTGQFWYKREGGKTTRIANPQAKGKPAKPDKTEVRGRLDAALSDPAKLTTDGLAELKADLLSTHTEAELKEIARAQKAKLGGTKAAKVDAILATAKAKVAAKVPSDPASLERAKGLIAQAAEQEALLASVGVGADDPVIQGLRAAVQGLKDTHPELATEQPKVTSRPPRSGASDARPTAAELDAASQPAVPRAPDVPPHARARAALDALGLSHDGLSDEQAGALHDQIKAMHAKATAAKPEPKAKPAPKPKAEPKPKKEPKAKPPATKAPATEPATSGGFGQTGDAHPLGQTPAEQMTALTNAVGAAGGYGGKFPPGGSDGDALGHTAAGFPKGVDRAELLSDLNSAVAKRVEAGQEGTTYDELYADVGKKHGLTKLDFARAMNDYDHRRELNVKDWPMSLDRIPDPALATMYSGVVQYTVVPKRK